MIGAIWAQGHDRAIGVDGTIPWHVPEDFAFFKKTTLGHPVIMGRTTWESLNPRYRPLPGRLNIVVTTNTHYDAPGAHIVSGISEAIQEALTHDRVAWVIGGERLYRSALPFVDIIAVTFLDVSIAGADAFAPEIPHAWRCTAQNPECGWHTSSTGVRYRFSVYVRPGFDAPGII